MRLIIIISPDLEVMIEYGKVQMFIQAPDYRISDDSYRLALDFFNTYKEEIMCELMDVRCSKKPELDVEHSPVDWYSENWKWFVEFYRIDKN